MTALPLPSVLASVLTPSVDHAVVLLKRFTACELRVARGIVRGYSYREIGHELGISRHTVRTHVREMAIKLEGLEALPPRTRIYLACVHPDVAAAIAAEAA